MYKQIIIARKDLNMSPGKLAAQVSHASMAFITNMVRKSTVKVPDNQFNAWKINRTTRKREPQLYSRKDLNKWAAEAREKGDFVFYAKPVDPSEPHGELMLYEPSYHYETSFNIDNDTYEQWIDGAFTKCVLQAKNKNQLLKAKAMAEEIGMKEGEDFFLIKDNCYTELEPEEIDENGIGRTLTVIGFRPMDSEVIDKIGKKYHLYT